MIEAYMIGLVAHFTFIAIANIVVLIGVADGDLKASAFALSFLALIFVPPLWPLVDACVVIYLLGWSLFTTARIIRHKGLV